jgi:hypothetical protein
MWWQWALFNEIYHRHSIARTLFKCSPMVFKTRASWWRKQWVVITFGFFSFTSETNLLFYQSWMGHHLCRFQCNVPMIILSLHDKRTRCWKCLDLLLFLAAPCSVKNSHFSFIYKSNESDNMTFVMSVDSSTWRQKSVFSTFQIHYFQYPLIRHVHTYNTLKYQ